MAQQKGPSPIEWREWEFGTTPERSFTVGTLRIWARRTLDEWRLAWSTFGSDKDMAKADPPPDEKWWRWVAQEGSSLKLSPCLPDQKLVASPQNPIRILPSEQARVYISVPVWVRASLPGSKETALVEIPCADLKRTWIGKPIEGEIAWWASTRARRELAACDSSPETITAPLVLLNRSSETLLVGKIFLRLPFLSVFGSGGGLWTDASHIIYKGPGEYETVQEEGETPEELQDGKLMTAPRARPKTGLATLDFSQLKAFAGLGS